MPPLKFNILGWFHSYNLHKVQVSLSIIFDLDFVYIYAYSALPMQSQFMTKSLHQAMLLAVLHCVLDVAP